MVSILLPIIYITFISLGLPDGLLGAAWPTMYPQMGVSVSNAGIVSIIICAGTIVSSLLSDRMTRKLGCGRVTAFSVATTAVALIGFSVSDSFWQICLWAIPYGLGAGGVDAALNNYVALHYSGRHMSWLHCMWGLGASVGPAVMGAVLSAGRGWPMGYQYVAVVQVLLSAGLFFSLPMWKKRPGEGEAGEAAGKALSLPEIFRLPGAKQVALMFFCYCALENTAALWSASYFVIHEGLSEETAAGYAGLFYFGITAGRAISGFITEKLGDTKMIHLGMGILLLGIAMVALPIGLWSTVAGFLLIGLGCAPIYPCVIHSTPAHFGAERSQAIIGVQMASAYVGSCLMPSVFGLLTKWLGAFVLPWYLLLILGLMALMHRKLNRVCPI